MEWNYSPQELLTLTKRSIELGITSYDHADIYGNYECEKSFGKTIALDKGLRNTIEIISKCGIKLKSDKFPDRHLKYYDYSSEYIVESVENSLKNLKTDYLDVLLLHRPAPLFNPEEVAKAFSLLKEQGKVRHFGVSNFTPAQFELLQGAVEEPLVTNQIEISPYCLDTFKDDSLTYLQKNKIKPMAWSPLAGGQLFTPKDTKGARIFKSLQKVATAHNTTNIDSIIYAWILKHPACILPIIGTGKFERIRNATEALSLKMTTEEWYEIYIASEGKELP
ncbi:MAG: aldo/keto reductase [Flavobacteriaceae bacterium]|nr:aldo/keto reductase [Flavobacteriaceae bacterium]